jgi:flavorubredoxin
VTAFSIADSIDVLSQTAQVGNTVRHVNAVVIGAERPLLVDTTFPAGVDDFLSDLNSVLDPSNLAFVAITHADFDHTGGLVRVLLGAPHARVITNETGMEKLKSDFGLPANRFVLVEPGASIDLGDRALEVHAVPLFDQPETMGWFDPTERVLCSSDCFGAVLPEYARFADEVDAERYRLGLQYWNQSNHPWVRLADATKFGAAVDAIRLLNPAAVSSTHGPVIRRDFDRVFDWIAHLPSLEPLPIPFPG